jgi:hypothetical protein
MNPDSAAMETLVLMALVFVATVIVLYAWPKR